MALYDFSKHCLAKDIKEKEKISTSVSEVDKGCEASLPKANTHLYIKYTYYWRTTEWI